MLTRYSFPNSSIEGLTQSRIQSSTVIALSAVAFVFGMVTVITSWRDARYGFVHAEQRSLHSDYSKLLVVYTIHVTYLARNTSYGGVSHHV